MTCFHINLIQVIIILSRLLNKVMLQLIHKYQTFAPVDTREFRTPIVSVILFLPDMKLFFRSLPVSISLLISLLCTATYTEAATFEVRNNCPFTVWAASVPVGGGRQLNTGRTWNIDVPAGTRDARIWGRTNCTFLVNGRGRCETGDCNGFLECIGNGAPPNTLAEYSLNQDNNLDYISISLVEGFNVAMEFSSNSNGCNRSIRCTADINGECPDDLRALGGCYNPCTVFKTDEYCCNSGTCGPTEFSRFFKDKCPDAYSYPKNDPTSLFTCPEGTNYRVVFCP